MQCEVCGETITVLPTDPTVEFNRLVNHIFLVHTLPGIEELLRLHA